MADNVGYNAGTGTTIAADDVGGVLHQRVKLSVGVDGSAADMTAAAGAVAASTPRVTLASDDPAVTSLAVMDDWDESDRAKVNPIVGQAGVAGGSGTVGNTTQRVVLATDVALPAGTNAIGKLAANSGVDIGDVDVTSVTPGTSASNLGKAEDGAHTSADVGVMALAVRKATPANLSDADGDYEPLQISAGEVWVRAQRLEVSFVTPADSSFTRPADTTAYAVNDLIANSATAGSVTPLSFTGATKTGNGGSGRIARIYGYRSDVTAASIRYHFLKTSHAVTNGDNGALLFTSLDVDNYLGYMDVIFTGTNDIIGSSGGLVNMSVNQAPIDYVLASGDTIYVFQQALSVFTPGNAATYGCRPVFEVFS